MTDTPRSRRSANRPLRYAKVKAPSHLESGHDGRAVIIGPNAHGVVGPDGRIVAIPIGWTGRDGKDKRLVAVPPNARTVIGRDGRLVVVLEGHRAVESKDGRMIAVPIAQSKKFSL